ncbi:nickel/cobalt transporter [Actinoplanes philippinensis]|uniref:nickel/cobalt transporter n=1 Tax=Actinoplanes philippinensis TaxID=35752 RepID=UPI0033D64E75
MLFSGLFRSLGAIAAGVAMAAPASPARPAAAHPADEVVQQVQLTPAAGTLGVELAVTPGPLVAPAFARAADTDGDSHLSAAETGSLVAALSGALTVRVDGAGAPLTITGSTLPPYPVLAAGGTITVAATAPMPTGVGAFEVTQSYDPGQPTSVQMNVVLDRTAGRGPGDITRSEDGRAISVRLVLSGGGTGDSMLDALREPLSSPWALLLLIGACALLGGLHALTPGHGKTMLAAYLVGSRGTPRQALALAGVITVTHTGSVLLIGAAVLAAGHYVVPGVLAPTLQTATGLMVLILGARLLRRRWTDLPRRHPTLSDRRHAAGSHHHTQSHCHHRPQPHSGDQDRPLAHPRRHTGGHPHDHAHPDHVNGHTVQVLDAAPARTRMRELITMGTAGGIIPCPEALGVLILATGLNRTTLGLAMITAFSAGLAAVLVALGLTLVTARDRMTAAAPSAAGPLLTRLPLLSAALVTALGLVMTTTGLLHIPPFR